MRARDHRVFPASRGTAPSQARVPAGPRAGYEKSPALARTPPPLRALQTGGSVVRTALRVCGPRWTPGGDRAAVAGSGRRSWPRSGLHATYGRAETARSAALSAPEAFPEASTCDALRYVSSGRGGRPGPPTINAERSRGAIRTGGSQRRRLRYGGGSARGKGGQARGEASAPVAVTRPRTAGAPTLGNPHRGRCASPGKRCATPRSRVRGVPRRGAAPSTHWHNTAEERLVTAIFSRPRHRTGDATTHRRTHEASAERGQRSAEGPPPTARACWRRHASISARPRPASSAGLHRLGHDRRTAGVPSSPRIRSSRRLRTAGVMTPGLPSSPRRDLVLGVRWHESRASAPRLSCGRCHR